MSQLAHIAEPRAVRFASTSFHAFKISETGRTYELGRVDGANVAEAVNAAIRGNALHHKEHLLIRETGPNGVRLHLYAIRKRSAPRYVWKDHEQKRLDVLYAAPVCTIDAGVVG